jgi:hypothetical protein
VARQIRGWADPVGLGERVVRRTVRWGLLAAGVGVLLAPFVPAFWIRALVGALTGGR